ncbi:helix-turn-helix domain-containing protein [Frankia sp. AgKG'84/4]|uniref:helix-turn-helix domain-containing protein n=1 Tax=Frankia sp. AgKG'84/4 TaxID=573490 RepID=UPI002010708A|nr:helix-turn-helix domain-containing protein [Frankia sp. AgKG'84/4]MCL9796652.1 TetR/AcrR family transcriptional regulator [Frankia sp. AgKG'84/4]
MATPGAPTRAQRRARTRDALSAAAITLFCQRGFDDVSVAEIAAAANVSKPTLFAHFPSKEDLVLHRILDHRGEAGRIVAGRGADVAPLTALREHQLVGLDRREPVTGLNEHPEVLAFHGMVFATPSLQGRLARYAAEDERALAEALARAAPGAGELTARLGAAQIIAVQRVLARENWARLSAGGSAAARHPEATAATRLAFAALARALPAYA